MCAFSLKLFWDLETGGGIWGGGGGDEQRVGLGGDDCIYIILELY